MNIEVFSYRYAREILQHPSFAPAWIEITEALQQLPLFTYPGKSASNNTLDVVQQVLNTYLDRRLAVDLNWDYHPLATGIPDSELAADFRKTFAGTIRIQAEVQFGNMARWYSDVFKFQAAYSQNLIDIGLSVIPMSSLARRIDSNVVSFERARRELPAAMLSITLPILLIGISPSAETPVINVAECAFANGVTAVTRNIDNRWRIVNAYLGGVPMAQVNIDSPTGPIAVPIAAAATDE